MSRWLRKAAVVEALHLNKDVQPDQIADFVSKVREDLGVSMRTNKVIITRSDGSTIDCPLGWWIIVQDGFLSGADNDTFIREYEHILD